MKTAIIILLFLFPFVATATLPDDIVGVWFTENDESKVQIYKVGNEYFGKIIWLKEPNDKNGNPKRDIKNTDPAKRNNPAIGIMVLKNMRFTDGKWKGIIYGPKRGREANCTLTLKDMDTIVGKATYGPFSDSKKLRRVK
jgi:uncharacterized protein (DUF2147 family)